MADNCYVKVITNPRKVDSARSPHMMNYFSGFYSVDENLRYAEVRPSATADKIVLNHYFLKSREEFLLRVKGGTQSKSKIVWFDVCDRNEEFDDGILKYRDARAKVYQPPDKSHATDRLLNALLKNLSPTLLTETPSDFYTNKLETFLTCRAVSSYLKTKLTDEAPARFFEELSLKAVLRSMDKMSVADAQLLMRELPNILSLPYPVIKEISIGLLQHIPRIIKDLNTDITWDFFINLLIRELPNILSLPYPVIKEIFVWIIQCTPHIMKYLLFNRDWDCFVKFHHLQKLLCEIHNSKQMIAARIDIKLMTTTGDFQILSVSDDKATVWKSAWFQKNGIGYQIQSYWNASELEIVAKSTVDGKINLYLRGLDIPSPEDRSKRFPYWVDYTKLTVNGETIFDKVTPAWHDKAYNYTFDVKADDEIKLQIEWQPHKSDD